LLLDSSSNLINWFRIELSYTLNNSWPTLSINLTNASNLASSVEWEYLTVFKMYYKTQLMSIIGCNHLKSSSWNQWNLSRIELSYTLNNSRSTTSINLTNISNLVFSVGWEYLTVFNILQDSTDEYHWLQSFEIILLESMKLIQDRTQLYLE